jgi:hypothetical protein
MIHYENTADIGLPKVSGWYRVIVQGDYESIDGHMLYSFDATWMLITVDEDGASGTGVHDEMIEDVIAWFGPIELPKTPRASRSHK